MTALLILVVTFGLMWVLFILPQQRRVRAHQALVSTVGVGDEVMTTAGLFGTVVALDDEVVDLEVSPGIVLRFARGAIARRVDQVLPADTHAADDAAATDRESSADDDTGAGEPDDGAGPTIRPRRGVMRRRPSAE